MASILTSLGYQIVLNTKFATVNADVIKATSASGLQLQDDGGNLGLTVIDGGSVGLGTSTANSFMTIGLTIDQGANDNEILALKSSDVAHGMTDIWETDTFTSIYKIGGTTGGFVLYGLTEGEEGVRIYAGVTSVNTTKSSLGNAAVVVQSALKSGTSVTSMSANANLFAIKADNTKWICDVEGDTWQLGVMTAASLVLGSTALSEANLTDLTDGGETALHTHAGGGDAIADADGDTKVQVEETGDEDIIRFDAAASEVGVWDATSLTMGLQPCFSAYAAAMTDLAINTNHTITYSGERFDTGGDYNTSTYTFTAPATGKYLLIASIFGLQADTSATYYRISIITSNLTYFVTESPGRWDSDPAYYHMKCVAIADMDTSDTAYVTIRQQGGGAQLDISASQSESLFMGYKLS